MVLRIVKLGLMLVIIAGITGVSLAADVAETNQPKKVIKEKIIEGQVVAISPNFLAINYGVDKKSSYEMALVIDKDTKVERKKTLKEINPGDGVWVKYAEISEVSKVTVNGEEKSKTRVLNRLVKVIRFMNAAPKGLQSSEEYLGAQGE
jgi:hypothetical protein